MEINKVKIKIIYNIDRVEFDLESDHLDSM